MKIPVAREGLRYIFLGSVITLTVFYFSPVYALIPFVAVAYLVFFFRDPPRVSRPDDSDIVAPADGRVVRIDEVAENGYLQRRVLRISIFMSIFNVHINYAPVSGRVDYMYYRKGSFKNALKDIASVTNENNMIGIKCRGTTMALRQIAGLVARRIVCRCAVGDIVRAGQKIGMIKFGSRVDLFLPLKSRLFVSKGQKVKGGKTILARM